MVKPPSTMQPETVDLTKAGRSQRQAFQDGGFHLYMARKIDMQRQERGLVIAPPPPPQLPLPGEDDEKFAGGDARARTSSVSFSPRGKRVSFSLSDRHRLQHSPQYSPLVQPREEEGLESLKLRESKPTKPKNRKRSRTAATSVPTRTGIASVLERLKKRHGSIESLHCQPSVNDGIPCAESAASSTFGTSEGNNSELSTAPSLEISLPETTRGFSSGATTPSILRSPIAVQQTANLDSPSPSKRSASPSSLSTKTRSQFDQRQDLFFRGVVVLVNGYTDPDAPTLQRLLHKHGGDLEVYESLRVTHVIATVLSQAKANVYRNMRRKPIPVVKPSWIVDSVAAQALLPYQRYILDQLRDKDGARIQSIASYLKPVSDCKTISTDDRNRLSSSTTTDWELDSCTYIALPSPSASPMKVGVSDSSRGVAKDHVQSAPTKAAQQLERTVANSLSGQKDSIIDLTEDCCHDSKAWNAASTLNVEVSPSHGTEKLPALSPAGLAESDKSIAAACPPRRTDDTKLSDIPANMDVASTSSFAPAHSRRTDKDYINGRVRTVGTDPDFLASFFSSSRLSFIGSYKQRAKHSSSSPSKSHLPSTTQTKRLVFHVDMDSFFASVVLRKYPQYRNKPVAISHQADSTRPGGGASSTSECATCNYEARKFGISKGMFLGQARELCPDLIVLPYDFDGYEDVAEQLAEILSRHATEYDGCVEQVSCDEAYMELHLPIATAQDAMTPEDLAEQLATLIRQDIWDTTECTASIGVAPNKLLAKLGTDSVKPNGCKVVRSHRQLLAHLTLRQLPGIGYKMERKLTEEGLCTVQDVWDLGDAGQSTLERILGVATGKKVFACTLGQDSRSVTPVERKTIGAECSYGVRFNGPYGPDYMIECLAQEVVTRMELVGVRGGGKVTLKLKQRKPNAAPPHKYLGHGSCYNLSRSCEVRGGKTNDWRTIRGLCIGMFNEMGVPKDDVRGMGITMSNLDLGNEIAVPKHKEALAFEHWLKPSALPNLSNVTSSGAPSLDACSASSAYAAAPVEETRKAITDAASRIDRQIGASNSLMAHGVTVRRYDVDPDIELPPLDQIRMSQVEFLPSPMRNHVRSTIEALRKSELDQGSILETDRRRTIRFTDVVSKKGRVAKGRHETKSGKRREDSGFKEARGYKKLDNNVNARAKHNFVAAPGDYMSLYDDDVVPLTAFMDENPCSDPDALDRVAQFLELCVTDKALTDLVVLLRCIKNRGDSWSGEAFGTLLSTVNSKLTTTRGVPLDSSFI